MVGLQGFATVPREPTPDLTFEPGQALATTPHSAAPGGETLALRIFNLLHYGHNAQVNTLCVTLLALALGPLLLWVGWRWVARLRNGQMTNFQ